MKRRIYISLTYILLLAFVNAVAPKELLHSFHHHTETKDGYSAGIQLESKHTHCTFLQWQLAGFDQASECSLVFFSNTISQLNNFYYSSKPGNGIEYTFLRGPPSIS